MAKMFKKDNPKIEFEEDQQDSVYISPLLGEEHEKGKCLTHDTYFMRGMLSGVLLCVLLAAIGFSVWFFWGNLRERNTENGISLNYHKISEKLELLEQYVNYVYLDEADAEKMEAGIYEGFIQALGDKYSAYYTAEEYKELMESTDGQYCGIGVYVHQDAQTGTITFQNPFENGPADKAGIQKGDVLVSVNGEDVSGKSLNDVTKQLKGTAGTVVTLQVKRGEKYLSIDVTLGEVEVPTVSYEMLADHIGYIQVTKFDKVTSEQFRSAIDDLLSKGMQGLVIDLRDNPGGLLTSVTDMLDRLIKEGTLVSTKDKNGQGETYTAKDQDSLDIPMSVLINGGSASASELFAGAIQDYGIGTLVGTTSYGKGIVQNIYGLKDGSAVKLTVSKYYTPKGRNIHGTGIEPDIKVELEKSLQEKNEITKEEDNQLQRAIKVVTEKLK